MHTVGGYDPCTTVCTDRVACADQCEIEGIEMRDWAETYGVDVAQSGVTLKFEQGTNVGTRLYLLDGEDYYLFKLKNREFTFDVDVSTLPCGVNGALYFVEMDKDGGLSYPGNKAGPKFGTGYCDA